MKSVETLLDFLRLINSAGITEEQLEVALNRGFLGEVIKNDNLTEITQNFMLQQYLDNCKLVMKLIDPEKLVVTRAMDSRDHYEIGKDRDGRPVYLRGYQMRFWKDGPGYLRRKGHVSDNTGSATLLFERISPKPQHPTVGDIDYPNDDKDLTTMCPEGYRWTREDVYRIDGMGEKFGMHVFRMIRV